MGKSICFWETYSLTEEWNSGLAPAGILVCIPTSPSVGARPPGRLPHGGLRGLFISFGVPQENEWRGVLTLPSYFLGGPATQVFFPSSSQPAAPVSIRVALRVAQTLLRSVPRGCLARSFDWIRPVERVIAHAWKRHRIRPGGILAPAIIRHV